MGDHVKITVIATGFKQDHMGRRIRTSSEEKMPRVTQQQKPAVPRFASEDIVEDEMPPVYESRRVAPVEKQAAPDPFFLQPEPVLIEEVPPPQRQEAQRPEPPRPEPPKMGIHHVSYDEPFDEEYARLVPSKPAQEGVRETRSEGDQQLDNLDIPAFLRRPN